MITSYDFKSTILDMKNRSISFVFYSSCSVNLNHKHCTRMKYTKFKTFTANNLKNILFSEIIATAGPKTFSDNSTCIMRTCIYTPVNNIITFNSTSGL